MSNVNNLACPWSVTTPPHDKTPQVTPTSLVPYVGRLGSGARVSASFQTTSSPGPVLYTAAKGGLRYDLGGFVRGCDFLPP